MRTPSKNTFFYRTFLMAASMNLHSLVCLNVKELLDERRCHIWGLSDSNGIWTRNHLVHKRTLNNLAKLVKNLIFLMNVLPDVYICSLRKNSAPLIPEGTVKCTNLVAYKFKEDANWNKQKWCYSQNKDLSGKWYCQTLKTLKIIYSEMKISLLMLGWWCFSCLHIQRIDIQYTDQLFWKIIA